MLVESVSAPLIFCKVQTGATKVVLSYDEHGRVPKGLLVEYADGSEIYRVLSPLKTSEQLSWNT
jgi:hypothetical protein